MVRRDAVTVTACGEPAAGAAELEPGAEVPLLWLLLAVPEPAVSLVLDAEGLVTDGGAA